MYIILYLMLSLNLLMGTLAYTRGDQPGVAHAATFVLVSLVALGLVWMTRKVDR